MAIKTYSGAAGVEAGVPNTKLRAEQMKSEDGFTSLAVDLEAIRGQVKDIIGAADYKEEITGEYAKVQIVDLAAHLDASGASSLSVKQAANVIGAFSVNSDRLTVAAATGNTVIKGTLEVDGESTLASAIIEDVTPQHIMFAGAGGAVEGSVGLKWDGIDLIAGSAKITDISNTHVLYAGPAGALSGSAEMIFAVGTGLTLTKDLSARSGSFSGDLTVAGNLLVSGDTLTVNVGELTVEDKNILIANVTSPTDVTADGAGITIKGATDKTILWMNASDSFEFSEAVVAPSGSFLNLASRLAKSNAQGKLVNAEITDFVQGTANQVTVGAVNGSGMSTLSLPQSIHTDADVEFDSLKLGDLTDNRLLKTDASTKLLVSAQIMDFITGSVNQVNLAAGAFGNVVLSTPQDIHTGASPEFAALNLAAYGDLLAVGSNFKVSATAELLFGDSYKTGSTYTSELKLAGSSAEWSAIESAYGAEKTLLGMLADASPATNKRLVKVGTAVSAGPDFFIGAGDASGAFPTGAANYQSGKSDVYVNGQKQVEGVSADFEFADATGADKVKVAFKYNLQIGDVVELIRYPAAAK